jgi:foldase protein PrsA
VAATVNGTDITVGEVEANIAPQEGTISKELFAQFLGIEIQWAVLSTAIKERFDVEFTEEESRAEADAIFEELKRDDETREGFLAERGITEEFLVTIGEQRLYDRAIREQLAGEVAAPGQDEIESALEDARSELTEVCVSHILVETQEEATEVLGRLQGGEDFAEVAADVSTDPGSAEQGGVLPCGPPTGYVPPFAEATLIAPIGDVYPEVVETEFGYHVVLVSDRTEPAEGDLPTEAEIVESLSAQAVITELEAWFLEAIEAAEVTVEERYGTWETEPQPRVVAPTE